MSLEQIRQILRDLVLLAALVCLGFLGYFLVQLSRTAKQMETTLAQAEVTLQSVKKTSDDLQQKASDLQAMTNATLYQVGDAAHELASTARTQQIYWTQISQKSVETIDRTNALLSTLQTSVQGADKQATQISDAALSAFQSLPPVMQASQHTMEEGTQALQSINQLLQNPGTLQTLDNINKTTAHLENTTKTLDKVVTDAAKPKSLVVKIFTTGLDYAYKIFSFFQ